MVFNNESKLEFQNMSAYNNAQSNQGNIKQIDFARKVIENKMQDIQTLLINKSKINIKILNKYKKYCYDYIDMR